MGRKNPGGVLDLCEEDSSCRRRLGGDQQRKILTIDETEQESALKMQDERLVEAIEETSMRQQLEPGVA